MDDAATDAGKSIHEARQSFTSYEAEMSFLRRPNGTVTTSRRAIENVVYDFYSDLFESLVYLPTHHLRQDEYIAPSILSSKIWHAITSIINCTALDQTRTSEESFTLYRLNSGQAVHVVPVGMQSAHVVKS
ncbi:unnamed protein product [Haemonchus placei]|uniref:Pkinase_fungal domain-containing protein n=1 Tax=Haemonchus placei TaxID=6290 RepID=A0A0N4X8A3_HAEPC|nr:unnamed protein product [Haemonchus placei]